MAGDAVHIKDLVMVLWRRKLTFIGFFLCGLAFTVLVLQYIQPYYQARTLLLIDGSVRDASQDLQALSSTIKFDNTLILGEAEILRSRTLAAQVVKKMNLTHDPEFSGQLREHNREAFKTVVLNAQGLESKTITAPTIDPSIERAVGTLLKNLRVRPIPGSFAIGLEYKSVDPQKAASIVNTLAQMYIDTNLAAQHESTQSVTDWLDKRLNELRAQVREAEQAAAQHRVEHNLPYDGGSAGNVARMNDLKQALLDARLDRKAAEAQRAQLKQLFRNHDLIDTAPPEIVTDFVRALKLDAVRVERDMAEQSGRYGPKHPVIKARQEELSTLKQTINAELRKSLDIAEDKIALIAQNIETLENTLQDLGDQDYRNNQAFITLQELEQEADSSRAILNSFLETYKKAKRQDELNKPKARIISYAVPPSRPAYPNKPLVISLSVVMSLFVALGAVLLLDMVDDRVYSLDKLRRRALVPILGGVPWIKIQNVYTFLKTNPASSAVETMKSLLVMVQFGQGASIPRVVSVTSSVPGEGKTTMALWMAQGLADQGKNVIVVDADFRSAGLSKILRRYDLKPLNDYLLGEVEVTDIIHHEENGVDSIVCTSVPHQALNLLSRETLPALVQHLRDQYDVVVIDTPASLMVSDAHLLARVSDQVVYVVRHLKTTYGAVMHGVQSLQNVSDSASVSLILNGIKKRL